MRLCPAITIASIDTESEHTEDLGRTGQFGDLATGAAMELGRVDLFGSGSRHAADKRPIEERTFMIILADRRRFKLFGRPLADRTSSVARFDHLLTTARAAANRNLEL